MKPQDRQHNEQVQDDSSISPKAKGERLRRVRYLANLSREEFCSDGGVNLTTLVSWEVGRFGGLSTKGASRVIARVAKEGVFCTLDWLLYEVGAGPEVNVDYKKSQIKSKSNNSKNYAAENSVIIKELMLFKKINENPIDFVIDDDAMLPYYQINDYVAGTNRFDKKISSLIGLNCIVQINSGRIVMRNLQRGPRANSYSLIATNLQTKIKDSIIYDVELVSAAPILWHRKKEPIV